MCGWRSIRVYVLRNRQNLATAKLARLTQMEMATTYGKSFCTLFDAYSFQVSR